MATLCLAFWRVLMQIEPNPSSSKELFKAIDYSNVWLLNVA